jgi:AcrR family transcriptional regulator
MGSTVPLRAARLPKEQRQGEIVEAATRLFCENGYGETSMSAIAADLKVSEAALYKHFENKRQILSRVLERWYEALYEIAERELPSIQGEKARLRYLVWRHLRTIADDPSLCRLIFTEVRTEPTYPHSELHRLNKRYSEMLMDVLRNGQRARAFRRSIVPELARDLIFGGIEHHVWGYLYAGRSLRPDALADQLIDMVCCGIDEASDAPPAEQQADRLEELIGRLEQIVPRPTK